MDRIADRKMILYRGSLKSCNYACSYCPFSKHPSSARERDKDEKEWRRFCESMIERADRMGRFGLMVVPYGEALLHPWYWDGLGALSALAQAEAVGAQTNLSFSLEDMVRRFEEAGGKREKLRLWATFHPEMVSAEVFAEKCRAVREAGIMLCAGAVGVPENRSLLTRLRKLLPESVYLWINRMDGLKRPYTPEEVQDFSSVDPCFPRELIPVCAQGERCQNRLFVEAGGRMRICNISAPLPGNWYQENLFSTASSFPEVKCMQKKCSCYLAYGGRDDVVNFLLFGEYPLFRVPPRRFAAAFLDIDGTLLAEGEKEISPLTAAGLTVLAAGGTKLFFATSLPLPAARKTCRSIWPLFAGGIFAGGAHIVAAWGDEQVYPLDETVLAAVKALKPRFFFRIADYRRHGVLYKITLIRPSGSPWEEEEVNAFCRCFPESLTLSVRFIHEQHHLQIISAEAGKEKGVEIIGKKRGIPFAEMIAAGDSPEDAAMLALCGKGIGPSFIPGLGSGSR